MRHYIRAVLAVLTSVLFVFSTLSPMILLSIAAQTPVASFTYAPKVPLVNQTVTFDASASYDPNGTIILYRWDFGDGSVPISLPGATETHAYSAVGSYLVTLTVTDNQAIQGNKSVTVAVDWYPTANLSLTPNPVLVSQTVTLNGSASRASFGTISSYFWDFGDGSTLNASSSSTTHAYSTVGNYTVALTVTDSYGFSSNCTGLITVIKSPIANFTFSPAYPIVGQTVTFDASTSTPDGGVIISYNWDFGDGQNASGTIVTYAYANYGSFLVKLSVTDSEGLSNTTSMQINVRQYPTANFTYSPTLPLPNQTVTFNASITIPNGGSIVSYIWNFGDGNGGMGVVVSHAYAVYGTYNVNLTVTDTDQLSNTLILGVRVITGPIANFTHTPVYPAINMPITFNGSGSYSPDSSIVNYVWNFGDGTNASRVPAIQHTYTVANVYIVTLVVTDADGLTANASMAVAVYTSVPVHDVAIIAVAPSALFRAVNGSILTINVTAMNEGGANETFNVLVYYGSNLLGTQTIISLAPNATQNLQFAWNTSGTPFAYYNTTATASVVTDETNTANNVLTGGPVIVTMLGDITGPNGLPDFKVDFRDIARVARSFLSNPITEPKYWDPACDLNGDGKVDMRDIATVAKEFGWHA